MTTKAKAPPPDEILHAEILGVSELYLFLGVKQSTVHVWGHRQQLPPADFGQINTFRAWKRITIIRWAAKTGRLPDWLKAEGARFEPPGGYVRKRRTRSEIAADAKAATAPAPRRPSRQAAAKAKASTVKRASNKKAVAVKKAPAKRRSR